MNRKPTIAFDACYQLFLSFKYNFRRFGFKFYTMEISTNIRYTLLSDPKDTKLLELMSVNLDDFNKRVHENIKLEYNPHYFTLYSQSTKAAELFWVIQQHIVSVEKKEMDTGTFINTLLRLARTRTSEYSEKDVENNLQLSSYIKMLYMWLNDYCPINCLSDIEKTYFVNEVDKIIENFKRRYPKLFLEFLP